MQCTVISSYSTFTERDFWEIVKYIDWENMSKIAYTLDRNLFYLKLIRKFDRAKCHCAYDVLTKKSKSLMEVLASYDLGDGLSYKCFGGSDSWWYCCNHIIGLGRREYLAHIADPKLIKDRLKSHSYVGNMVYWIPTETTHIEISNSVKFME